MDTTPDKEHGNEEEVVEKQTPSYFKHNPSIVEVQARKSVDLDENPIDPEAAVENQSPAKHRASLEVNMQSMSEQKSISSMPRSLRHDHQSSGNGSIVNENEDMQDFPLTATQT